MIVLGADLSFTRTGLVWLDSAKNEVVHHATVTIKPGPRRMVRAAKAFRHYLSGWGGPTPSLCIIEDAAYASPSRTTVAKLKELSAIFKLVLESYGIDYLEVSPTLVKKYITGKGTAEKHVVAQQLKRKYGIAFKDDDGHDLSDAAALAVWGMERG